jgi:hypothetical protein
LPCRLGGLILSKLQVPLLLSLPLKLLFHGLPVLGRYAFGRAPKFDLFLA